MEILSFVDNDDGISVGNAIGKLLPAAGVDLGHIERLFILLKAGQASEK